MNSSVDLEFMAQAMAFATAAGESGEVPVGAVLVAADRVIARAGNASIGLSDPTAHAEILTLRAAGKQLGNYRLSDCTLYVTLEPCPMCASALVHARIDRLVFAAADPKTGACGSIMDLVREPRLNHQISVTQGILADDARDLLQGFFRDRR